MERLDFASVMAVLRRNIPDENFGNQTDFLYALFLDVMLKYRCRILFTTRSRYENHISLGVEKLKSVPFWNWEGSSFRKRKESGMRSGRLDIGRDPEPIICSGTMSDNIENGGGFYKYPDIKRTAVRWWTAVLCWKLAVLYRYL